ncbi:hypothetical protein GCM10022254_06570 [Actinomadura meridiana]|uniref:YbaB/EbfC DNA-binding family protein n=1 Tax=Actinomadura meridiana TaxID=559626 RepID=A0ABP8BSW9_9ACTN
MTKLPESPEDALERLATDAQQRIREYQQLRDDLSEMTGTAQSDDHSVTVTVAPGGSVTDITLTDRALRHGPQRLSGLLMATIAQASADVAQRMAERVQPLAPSVDVIGMVRAQLPDLSGTDDTSGKGGR